LAEDEKPGAGSEPTPLAEIIDQKPVIADYTDDQSREAEHREVREQAEPRQKKAKTEPKAAPDDQEKRFRGLLNETLSEREKRQEVERERDRYKSQVEDYQRKLAAEAANDPAPDKFKDPVAHDQWLERQMDRRAQAIAAKQIGPMREQLTEYALGMSELRAKNALGERYKPFEDWLLKQPDDLKDRFMAQPDPYAAAFQHYRAATTFERLGQDDLDTYEKKLFAKWEAEQKAKQAGRPDPYAQAAPSDEDEDPQPVSATPRSFAASRSTTPRDDVGRFTGPRPLGVILQDKPKHKRPR